MFTTQVYTSQFLILATVFFLPHAFCVTYEYYHYVQLTQFNIFQQYNEDGIFI